MLTNERARKAHLVLWLILGLWLAVGLWLAWSARMWGINLPFWPWVVSLVATSVFWVVVVFRDCIRGRYHLPWSRLLPSLQSFYWGQLRFQPKTERRLLAELASLGVAGGCLAVQGYRSLGSYFDLLALFTLLGISVVIFWLRAQLTLSLGGWRTTIE